MKKKKVCSKQVACKNSEPQPLSNFYVNAEMSYGRMSKCILCTRYAVEERRKRLEATDPVWVEKERQRHRDKAMRQYWKVKGTPAGWAYTEHTASGRRTSGSDYGSWPTATLHDADRGGQAKRAMGETRHGSNLQDFVLLSAWTTPQAHDTNKRAQLTSWPTYQALGPPSSGFLAETAKPGQLNPSFSRWLMGYLPSWDMCAIRVQKVKRTSRRSSRVQPTASDGSEATATPSTPTSPPRSSTPASKPSPTLTRTPRVR